MPQPLYNRIAIEIANHKAEMFDSSLYNTIDTAIKQAWEEWSQDRLKDYYERGVKPKEAPYHFRKDFVERTLNAAYENYRPLIDSFKGR